MKKIFTSLFIIALSFNFTNADNIKQSKDLNQTMTNDEFMKEFMRLEQELATAKKTGKTLDELNKLLGVDGKKK